MLAEAQIRIKMHSAARPLDGVVRRPALTTPPPYSSNISWTHNTYKQHEKWLRLAPHVAKRMAEHVSEIAQLQICGCRGGRPGRALESPARGSPSHCRPPRRSLPMPDHRRRPVVAAQHAREPQPGAPAGAAAAAKQRSTRPGGAARKGVRPTVWWSDGRAEAVGRWLQSPSASSLMMMPLARRRSGAAVSPWPMQHGAQTLTEQLRAWCATHGVTRAAGAASAVCRLMVRPGASTSQGLRGALRLVGRGLRRRNSAPRRVLAAGEEERVTQRVTRRAQRRFSRGP
jgi:hypothetical protein